MEAIKAILRRAWPLITAGALLLALGIWGIAIGSLAHRDAESLASALARHEQTAKGDISALHERIDALPPRSAREYLVQACEGGIGVYNGMGTVLYELLPVDVSTLPAADRAMLEAGILVTGEAALRSLCADYTS